MTTPTDTGNGEATRKDALPRAGTLPWLDEATVPYTELRLLVTGLRAACRTLEGLGIVGARVGHANEALIAGEAALERHVVAAIQKATADSADRVNARPAGHLSAERTEILAQPDMNTGGEGITAALKALNQMTPVLLCGWDEEEDCDWGAKGPDTRLDRIDFLQGQALAALSPDRGSVETDT